MPINPPVKIILAWQEYQVGEVIYPNATTRDWLIGNGYAEPVTVEKPLLPGKTRARIAGSVQTR